MKTFLILSIAAVSFCLSSCNTIAGIGEDISSGGRALNNAATNTQDRM